MEDIIKIYTEIGYASVQCTPSTQVEELVAISMKTVSLLGCPKFYGLHVVNKSNSAGFKHILCKHLTYSEIKSMYDLSNLHLTITHFPTKFEEAVRNDRPTLFYLYEQIKKLYYLNMKGITDTNMAFEIGCSEIRSFVPATGLTLKSLISAVKRVRDLTTFFPPCVLQIYQGKVLKRMIENQLLKILHYTEEDCVLDTLNRYLILLEFDRSVFKCWFGSGWSLPVELIIGPRHHVSIIVDNTGQPRLLTYFKNIRQVIVSKSSGQETTRYQVKLKLDHANDNSDEQQNESITFTFTDAEEADSVVHLLESYCGEVYSSLSTGGLTELMDNTQEKRITTSNVYSEFLPNGCPFRLFKPQKSELKNLEINRALITLEQVIGEGQYSDVYKGTFTRKPSQGPDLVAIKTGKLNASITERKRCFHEAGIMSKFDHPHIIKLYGVCSDDPIYLVMEYAPLGELRHYLLSKQKELSLSQLITYSYQTVTALACLEAKNTIHRDIAARNILVWRPDWVKLSDFGMAIVLNNEKQAKADHDQKLPIKWMAPESLHHRTFSVASDVWMFGVCTWEILSKGVKPFSKLTNGEAVERIARGLRLKRPDICPLELYALLQECWNTQPVMRPTFSALKPRLRELAAQFKTPTAPLYVNYAMGDPFPNNSKELYQNEMNRSRTPFQTSYINLHSNWGDPFQLDSDVSNQIHCTQSVGNKIGTEATDEYRKHENFTNHQLDFGEKSSTKDANSSDGNSSIRDSKHDNRSMSSNYIPSYLSNKLNELKITNQSAFAQQAHLLPDVTNRCMHKAQSSDTIDRKSRDQCTNPTGSNFSSTDNIINMNMRKCNDSNNNNNNNTNNSTNYIDKSKKVIDATTKLLNNPNTKDRVFAATVQIIKTVGIISQQLVKAEKEHFPSLIKDIEGAVKTLMDEIEAEFGVHTELYNLVICERQLKASLSVLQNETNEINMPNCRGALFEDYRRRLMGQAYAIAADAHSVYTVVFETRKPELKTAQ